MSALRYHRVASKARSSQNILCLLLVGMLFVTSQVQAGTAFHDSIFGVATTSNVVYGTGPINGGGGSMNLLLDVYRPVDVGQGTPPTSSPGIVFVHGGAWQSGSKTDSYAVQFGQLFASLGYVVASINYRMLADNVPETHGGADGIDLSTVPSAASGGFDLPQPATTWTINAGVEDLAKAIGWMRDNAATYNVDTAHIGVGGASAGAINSLILAYSNPSTHTAPQAVVSYVGALPGLESTLIQADDSTPAFVVNGSVDPLINLALPQAMVNRMNAMGVPNEFYVQQGVGHDVNLNLVFGGQTLLQHQIDFLATHLVPEPDAMLLAGLGVFALGALGRRRMARGGRRQGVSSVRERGRQVCAAGRVQ